MKKYIRKMLIGGNMVPAGINWNLPSLPTTLVSPNYNNTFNLAWNTYTQGNTFNLRFLLYSPANLFENLFKSSKLDVDALTKAILGIENAQSTPIAAKPEFTKAEATLLNLSSLMGDITNLAVGAVNTIKNAKLSKIEPKSDSKGLGLLNATNIMGYVGQAADIVSSFLPDNTEYNGPKGDITLTMDSVYDGISDAAMALPGIGPLVGGVLKSGKLLGKGLNALGGGTDGMTSTDAILGSSFLQLTPLGLINGFGGDTADTITKDDEAFETVGSSYTGSEYKVDDALTKSGKKYGLFSKKAMLKANDEIAEATRLLNIIKGISNEATDRFDIQSSMSAFNDVQRRFALQSGYRLNATQVGKQGMKFLNKARDIIKALKGSRLPFNLWVKDINPDYLSDNYDLETAYKYLPEDLLNRWKMAVNSKDPDKYLNYRDKNGIYIYHLQSIAPIGDDYIFLKKGKEDTNPELHWETDTYWNGSNGLNKTHDLVYEGDRYYYRKKKVASHKEGGTIIEPVDIDTLESYIEPVDISVLDEDIPEFQEGGKFDGYDSVSKFYNRDLSGINFIKDSKARTEGNNLYINNDEDAVHELYHYFSNNIPDESYKEYYDKLDDNKLKSFGADLDFIKRTGDPSDLFNPSELVARIYAAKYKSPGSVYDTKFFLNARKNENLYGYNMRDLLHMFNDENLVKLFNVKSTLKFQEGGSINVIPDGALHANLHHMDNDENITKKGIPVVDNDGELAAEVEREEIIFRLEVTKKLESLLKIYESDDKTLKEKDEAALEAGKLLTKEILYNTLDNTNNLL